MVAWGARAYLPAPGVVSQLGTIYRIALGLTSWCVTLPILSKLEDQGWLGLCPPATFLLQMAAKPFLFHMRNQHQLPSKAVRDFELWCRQYGVLVSSVTLPYFQLGAVPWKYMGFIALAAKAFWMGRRHVMVTRPPYLLEQLPIWH